MHVNGFWYFFGRNVTDEVGNQKTLYYATSNNLCFCTTWQNGETWKSHILLNWIVLHTQCTCALSSWKKKLSPVMRLTFVEIVRYPINTIHRLLLQAWRRTIPIFCTATDSVTDMANTEHVGNTAWCYVPFLGPVWCTQSIVLTARGGSALTRWYFKLCFVFFWWKSMQHLCAKGQRRNFRVSCFPR